MLKKYAVHLSFSMVFFLASFLTFSTPLSLTGPSAMAADAQLSMGKTHYKLKQKEGQKNLLLIHDGSFSSWTWTRIRQSLARRGFNILIYDMYGMGKSNALNVSRYNRAMFLRQIDELLGHVGWTDQPLYIVGTGTGASLGVALANQTRQAKVAGVALISPAYDTWGTNGPIGEALSRIINENPESPWLRLVLKRIVEKQAAEYLLRIPEDKRATIQRNIEKETKEFSYYDNLYRRLLGDLYSSYATEYRKFGRADIPTLLLSGAQDRDVPDHQISAIRRRISHIDVVRYPGMSSEFSVLNLSDLADRIAAKFQ